MGLLSRVRVPRISTVLRPGIHEPNDFRSRNGGQQNGYESTGTTGGVVTDLGSTRTESPTLTNELGTVAQGVKPGASPGSLPWNADQQFTTLFDVLMNGANPANAFQAQFKQGDTSTSKASFLAQALRRSRRQLPGMAALQARDANTTRARLGGDWNYNYHGWKPESTYMLRDLATGAWSA